MFKTDAGNTLARVRDTIAGIDARALAADPAAVAELNRVFGSIRKLAEAATAVAISKRTPPPISREERAEFLRRVAR
jgi:hypothetical protein